MARIAHFRRILKDDFFKKIKFIAEFLSARDILDAAAAENYHCRDRIWTPIQTLWAFLVQVLEPDSDCPYFSSYFSSVPERCLAAWETHSLRFIV